MRLLALSKSGNHIFNYISYVLDKTSSVELFSAFHLRKINRRCTSQSRHIIHFLRNRFVYDKTRLDRRTSTVLIARQRESVFVLIEILRGAIVFQQLR